jgi:hypothetical protein
VGAVGQFSRRTAKSGVAASNAIKASIGLVTVGASVLAGWRFGVAWGVVVILAVLLVVVAMAGIGAEHDAIVARTTPPLDPGVRLYVVELRSHVADGNALAKRASEMQQTDEMFHAWRDEYDAWVQAVTHWFNTAHPADAATWHAGLRFENVGGEPTSEVEMNERLRRHLVVRLSNLDGLICHYGEGRV